MTPIVKADVTAHASELETGVSDTAWVDVLNHVNQISLRSVDSDYDRRLARIYLAAHILYKIKTSKTGAVGPIVSESAGGVKRSYAPMIASSTTSGSLGTTTFGQEYLDILASSQVNGPFVV